jgi:type II secretory pathway component GspD/PulD (secretin)
MKNKQGNIRYSAFLVIACIVGGALIGATKVVYVQPKNGETNTSKAEEETADLLDPIAVEPSDLVGSEKKASLMSFKGTTASHEDSELFSYSNDTGDSPSVTQGNGYKIITTRNRGSYGSFEIIEERKRNLYNRQPTEFPFRNQPINEVLHQLARKSGVSFSLSGVADEQVSGYFYMSPFKAMDTIAEQNGYGVYYKNGMWLVQKKNPEKLVHAVIQLKNIHLKFGGGSGGGDTFGDAFGESDSNSSSSSSSNNDNSNISSDSTDSTDTTGTGSGSGSSDSRNRSLETEESYILQTIEKYLMIGQQQSFASVGGDASAQAQALLAQSANGQQNTQTLVSYDPDSNRIFLVGTEQQIEWVREFVNGVDRPLRNIEIIAKFVEMRKNPTQTLGVDWSNTLTNFNVNIGTDTNGLILGNVDVVEFPDTNLINADALSANIQAIASDNDVRVNSYSPYVILNNQEIALDNTIDIPVLDGVTAQNNAQVDTTTANSSTTFETGIQSIGTVTRVRGHIINEEEILLTVEIEVSSLNTSASGESVTGRQTQFRTTYSGDMVVPADGEWTVVIGGLERISESTGLTKVPILGDIPIFGFPFRSETKTLDQTNIMLMITPKILKKGKQSTTMFHSGQISNKPIKRVLEAGDRASKALDLEIEKDAEEEVKKEKRKGIFNNFFKRKN